MLIDVIGVADDVIVQFNGHIRLSVDISEHDFIDVFFKSQRTTVFLQKIKRNAGFGVDFVLFAERKISADGKRNFFST